MICRTQLKKIENIGFPQTMLHLPFHNNRKIQKIQNELQGLNVPIKYCTLNTWNHRCRDLDTHFVFSYG